MTSKGRKDPVFARIVGRVNALGFELINKAVLETLTLEVTKSLEIEVQFVKH